MININTYNDFIDAKEFFNNTKEEILNITRTMFDNCKCNLISKVTGQELKGLLDATKEELETDDEYIFITKMNDGYLIRQEVYDDFEEEYVCNEWVVC